jgi:thymidine kinase
LRIDTPLIDLIKSFDAIAIGLINNMPERLTIERLIQPEFTKPSIEVITGSMFSGKSKELIKRLKIAAIAITSMQNEGILEEVALDERIKVFKPTIDNRRGEFSVNSQDGESFSAIPIDMAKDALAMITENTLIVGFDESQFWSENDLVETCTRLAVEKRVIVAGLSLDFRGVKWGGVGSLALSAEKTDILPAVCTKCGDKAIFTQRIIEKAGHAGEKVRYPANYNEPVEVIGGTNLYEARCRTHHEVPGRPINK